MPFDLQRIELLALVAEEGTIAGAADVLNYSSSGVSQQLRQLECDLGATLIDRDGRGATLTEAGRVLLEHGEFIVAQMREAECHARAVASLNGGRLRMATFRSAGQTIVAEAIAYFRGHWPAVDVTLREGEPEVYLDELGADRLDLALTFEYDGVDFGLDERLGTTLLLEEEMLVVLPSHHSAARSKTVVLAALERERWIGGTSASAVADFTLRTCREAGFDPAIAVRTDDYRIAQSLVASGAGLLLLPALATQHLHPGLVSRPVGGGAPKRRIYVAHRAGGDRSPAVATMVRVLREVAADYPGAHA